MDSILSLSLYFYFLLYRETPPRNHLVICGPVGCISRAKSNHALISWSQLTTVDNWYIVQLFMESLIMKLIKIYIFCHR